ncbi:hypothetical protein EJ08DRAFT_650835 [Tothia fuscella]|uniref:Uncharacterized protein n=1 Tax=Tothia fuscella TaxID=1048955 RepID=A0A9P4TXH7_9PEZI|nr:hypothetical protein EJ08DRAFT_650835 [Tothia fuscella]
MSEMNFNTQDQEAEALPPPYTPPTENLFDEEEEAPATTITIHAPTVIHGSNNIVSLSPIDTPRLAALLASALNQKNQATLLSGRQSNFNFTFNCMVNVVGDRNVIGNVGLRSRAGAPVAGPVKATEATGVDDMPNATSLGKRKASEEPEDSPEAKRTETSTDAVAGSVSSP